LRIRTKVVGEIGGFGLSVAIEGRNFARCARIAKVGSCGGIRSHGEREKRM
jgi:hypothetical protein